MNVFTWLLTRIEQRLYLRKDFRVMMNSLRVWDSYKCEWISVISGLPNSYGRSSVTTVYMQGKDNLMFALLFRSNPMDFFSKPRIHPVMVFYTHSRGFWREDFWNLDSLRNRVGNRNYDFLMSKASIDWSSVIVS